MGHFVMSSKERETRDKRAMRKEEREKYRVRGKVKAVQKHNKTKMCPFSPSAAKYNRPSTPPFCPLYPVVEKIVI